MSATPTNQTTVGRSVRTLVAIAVAAATAVLAGLVSVPALAAAGTYTAASYGAACDGTRDDSAAIQKAINAAGQTGGTVLLPGGRCMISTGLQIPSGRPITLAGAGSGATTLAQTVSVAGILHVLADHTTIRDLTLDNHRFGNVLTVTANYTTMQRVTALGGPSFFALFYSGPPGAKPDAPAYNYGNQILDSNVTSTNKDDGISYSFQSGGLIQNLVHTGSRLALYVDTNSTIDGYTYHPGVQTKALDGFYITTPSSNLVLRNIVSYGSGGIVGTDGEFNNPNRINRNIQIFNEVLMSGSGYRLSVGDVDGFTLNGCTFPGTDTLRFNPNLGATNITVENCQLPSVRFASLAHRPIAGAAPISNARFLTNTYTAFQAAAGQWPQTFGNWTGAPCGFTVSGGAWWNRAGGFFRGSNTTFTVSNLTGY